MVPRYTKVINRVNTNQPATKPASRLVFLSRNILEDRTVLVQMPKIQKAEKSMRKSKMPPAFRNGVAVNKNNVTAHQAAAWLNCLFTD